MFILFNLLAFATVWLFGQIWFQLGLATLALMFLTVAFAKKVKIEERLVAVFLFFLLMCPVMFGSVIPSYNAKEEVAVVAPKSVSKSISDEAAFGVAAHALALAKTPGCSSFEVTWRTTSGSMITVKCYDGRQHNITNGPMIELDGRPVGY